MGKRTAVGVRAVEGWIEVWGEFRWMWQVRNVPSSWSHCFKGAHSGKERVTFGEKRETCHYERWVCTPKEKHGILGQEETGGQDLKCILSVCAAVPSLVRLSLAI